MPVPFLFWNLDNKPLQDRISALVREHDVQAILLVECDISETTVLESLRAAGIQGFTYAETPVETTDIKIFVRFPEEVVRPVYDDVNNHVTIRRVILNGHDFLLVLVHSQSKREFNPDDQMQIATRLGRRIDEFEKQFGHRRTILVGDLNMNPFEPGVV